MSRSDTHATAACASLEILRGMVTGLEAGATYGRLTVICIDEKRTHRSSVDGRSRLFVDCRCRCGYKNYGGRGISVCREWRGSYVAFLRREAFCQSADCDSLGCWRERALAPKWISVGERMPAVDTKVIVWGQALSFGEMRPYEAFAAYLETYIDGFDWVIANDADFCHPQNVTHWQPLPPAPEPRMEKE